MEAQNASERVDAVTATPNGAEIRLVYDPANESERVEIERKGDTVILSSHNAGSFRASQVYNNTVEPFVDDNGHELHN